MICKEKSTTSGCLRFDRIFGCFCLIGSWSLVCCCVAPGHFKVCIVIRLFLPQPRINRSLRGKKSLLLFSHSPDAVLPEVMECLSRVMMWFNVYIVFDSVKDDIFGPSFSCFVWTLRDQKEQKLSVGFSPVFFSHFLGWIFCVYRIAFAYLESAPCRKCACQWLKWDMYIIVVFLEGLLSRGVVAFLPLSPGILGSYCYPFMMLAPWGSWWSKASFCSFWRLFSWIGPWLRATCLALCFWWTFDLTSFCWAQLWPTDYSIVTCLSPSSGVISLMTSLNSHLHSEAYVDNLFSLLSGQNAASGKLHYFDFGHTICMLFISLWAAVVSEGCCWPKNPLIPESIECFQQPSQILNAWHLQFWSLEAQPYTPLDTFDVLISTSLRFMHDQLWHLLLICCNFTSQQQFSKSRNVGRTGNRNSPVPAKGDTVGKDAMKVAKPSKKYPAWIWHYPNTHFDIARHRMMCVAKICLLCCALSRKFSW